MLENTTTNTEKVLLIGMKFGKREYRPTDMMKVTGLMYCHVSKILKRLESIGLMSKKKLGRDLFYKITKKGDKYVSDVMSLFVSKRGK